MLEQDLLKEQKIGIQQAGALLLWKAELDQVELCLKR